MKSIIRKILKEEIQKPTIQDVILKDVMNTFTKESLKDKPDIMWRGGGIDDTLKQYEGVWGLANNLLIPHIENTYELDMVKDREIIMPILAKWIRNMYYSGYPLPGDTIEMIKMGGEDPNPIIPGTKGIVDHIKTLRFGGGYEEHVDVNWENGRTLKLILPPDEIKIVDRILKEDRKKITPKEVHKAADSVGMKWDNNKKFMDFSEKVTGKRHIDDMTSKERKKLIKKILKEDVGERSWTSEWDRMKWVVGDFDRMLRDLYPFWLMNEVDGRRMMSSLGEMNWRLRDEVYAAVDKIYFYWKLAMEDFDDQNLYYNVDWGDGYDAPGSKQAQNRKKIMIYTKKANPYVGEVISAINDPKAIQLVR